MRLSLALASLLFAAPAYAGTVAPGFTTFQMAREDDFATGAISLGFNVNYFGTTYSSTHVSSNGYLTFGSGQTSFSPQGLGANYAGLPIIAAFFADVDTRNQASGVTSYGTGTYAGRAAFGATWPGVGYFGNQADKLNTFQIILTDRSDTGVANFDIYLNYDAIQWETGSADDGVGGLGGTSASAGFNAGVEGNPTGTYYELAGSQVNGAFLDGGAEALASGSNVGVPGQFVFAVRSGLVEIPPEEPTDVPEPASMAVLGFGLLGLAAARRRVG